MGTVKVLHHRYMEALDLTGKDLLSLAGSPIAAVEEIVGSLARPESMVEIEVPAETVTSMSGEVAEQVHEWPNARLGKTFRKLSIHVRNGAMCNLIWGFDLSEFLPNRDRGGLLGKLLNPAKWF